MTRLDLHDLLKNILGSNNVYFQPPESQKILYPCIVYSLDDFDVKYSDNEVYTIKKKYNLIVVDKDPDSSIPEKMMALPFCKFERPFTSGGLHHYVFNIYF